ncbi:MAG: DNA repair and recombination protein RadA [Candidatus Korarchaeota archaeon]|nr:DNA repair and recombination protein RadA [Candidatus Korarchaeota archaeon]
MKNLTVRDLKHTSKGTMEKLEEAGILLIKDLMMFHPNRLAEVVGVSKETAEKLVERAFDLMEVSEEEKPKAIGLERAEDLEAMEEKLEFLTTGSETLDELLHGGFPRGKVTELAGEYGAGKSQACYTALANAFLPKKEGGLRDGDFDDIGVIHIDAEHTYSNGRFKEILAEKGLDEGKVLPQLWVGRPKTSHHQETMLKNLVKVIRDYHVQLITVDSITKLPRTDFEGRGELYERQRLILRMVEQLRRIAENYNIVVLITNQVVAKPGTMYGRDKKPIGGHVLAHNVDTRLWLKQSSTNTRYVEIIDSSWLPPGKVKVAITKAGIEDE